MGPKPVRGWAWPVTGCEPRARAPPDDSSELPRVADVFDPDDVEPLLPPEAEPERGCAVPVEPPPCGADRAPPELSPPPDREPESPDDPDEEEGEESEPPRDLACAPAANDGSGTASEKATRETLASEVQCVMAVLRRN